MTDGGLYFDEFWELSKRKFIVTLVITYRYTLYSSSGSRGRFGLLL